MAMNTTDFILLGKKIGIGILVTVIPLLIILGGLLLLQKVL